jgi:poly(A) polymerase
MIDPSSALAGAWLDLGPAGMTVAQFLALFRTRGINGHVCGGAVRDALLGEPFNDVDFTFAAHISVLREIFVEQFGADAIQLYKPGFGLLKVGPSADNVVDITMYRSSDSVAGAASLDEVQFELGPSLEVDARIRDLSVNALYWDDVDGVQDPLGCGLDDLRARCARLITDPRKARIDPRLSIRLLLFAARGYTLGQGSLRHLRERLSADVMAYSPTGLAHFVRTSARDNPAIAQAMLSAARPFLDSESCQRMSEACVFVPRRIRDQGRNPC